MEEGETIDLAKPRDQRHAMAAVRQGYQVLFDILVEALNQAQQGKGAERHNLGGDIPFDRQRMQQISELIGSVDGMTYQACKKITEGVKLPTLDRQVAELLGAINYIAGMIVFLRARDAKEKQNGFHRVPLGEPYAPVPDTKSEYTQLVESKIDEIAKSLGIDPAVLFKSGTDGLNVGNPTPHHPI